MRFVSTRFASMPARTAVRRAHTLLDKLGLAALSRRLTKPKSQHYRLRIRCQGRADMLPVLALVAHTLQPAGLVPSQSMRPGRDGGRELVLDLYCTPPQRRYLVQFVHQAGLSHPVRWELRPGP
ncbi:hypothetical protein [Aeromonas veronii]|uniref:hypothetical protein n=1 Tax=Aeromonas veronii TaxID=654 RepID=UPI003DA2B6A1